MWSRVVTCGEAGRRLRRAELPSPVSGYLFVLDFDGRNNNFRRHLRVADLKAPEPPHPTSLLLPLFSPELVSLQHGKMLLAGVELRVDGDTVYEVQQMWLVEPLGQGPSDASVYGRYRTPAPPYGPLPQSGR